MSTTPNKEKLISSLKKIGLKKGDNILVNYEFYRIGPILNNLTKLDYYNTVLNSIIQIIGKKGTVAVNTYSFSIARNKKKYFDHFKTISNSGGFSEFFRKKKEATRSTHPVFSVSAIGKLKNKICFNNSLTNYGYGSPYERMLDYNFKILNIGSRPSWNPFLHVAELKCALPFFYNRSYKIKYRNKKKLENKIFFSYVRFKKFDTDPNFDFIEKKLKRKKFIRQTIFGKGKIYLFDANIYLREMLEILSKNSSKVYPNAFYKL